jgi:hypothetical protein
MAYISDEIYIKDYPDLADAWDVLSLPLTLIIDAIGQPCGVNHSVTMDENLSHDSRRSPQSL